MPAYTAAHPLSHHLQVFLDGVQQLHCTVADTDEGWVEVYEIDEHGRAKCSPWVVHEDGSQSREMLPPVRKYGKVEVTLKCSAPPGTKLE